YVCTLLTSLGTLGIGYCYVFFLCFFFSSRRRHTRFSRDWSSDVCSSDLYAACLGEYLSGGRAAEAALTTPHADPRERFGAVQFGRILRDGRIADVPCGDRLAAADDHLI